MKCAFRRLVYGASLTESCVRNFPESQQKASEDNGASLALVNLAIFCPEARVTKNMSVLTTLRLSKQKSLPLLFGEAGKVLAFHCQLGRERQSKQQVWELEPALQELVEQKGAAGSGTTVARVKGKFSATAWASSHSSRRD